MDAFLSANNIYIVVCECEHVSPYVCFYGEFSLQKCFRRHPSNRQFPLSFHLIVVAGIKILSKSKVSYLHDPIGAFARDEAVTSSYVSVDEVLLFKVPAALSNVDSNLDLFC